MSTSKKSTADTHFNDLIEAIKRCVVDKQPVKSTAKALFIPRSTLQRFVKKVKKEFADVDAIDDDRLLHFVRGCSKRAPTNQVN